MGFVFRHLPLQPVREVGASLKLFSFFSRYARHAADHMIASVFSPINANPAALKVARRDDGRGATAEWIQDEVTFVAAGFDDTLIERERLLIG